MAPGGTTRTGPPLPPNQVTALAGTDPRTPEPGSSEKPARGAQPQSPLGIVVPVPRGAAVRRAPSNPEEPRAQMAGLRAYWEGEFQLSDDVVNESSMGLHFPKCSEVGRTRK